MKTKKTYLPLLIVIISSMVSPLFGQIPNPRNWTSYKNLVNTLELPDPIVSKTTIRIPIWNGDTTLCTKTELRESGEDTTCITIRVNVEAKYGKKSLEKRRKIYEKKRLQEVQRMFTESMNENDRLRADSVVNLMVIYLYDQRLLSSDMVKEYQEVFVNMRAQLSQAIAECFKTNSCKVMEISSLFEYFTVNLECKDLLSAYGMIQTIYIKEYQTLRLPSKGRLDIERAVQYYACMIMIYNLGFRAQNPTARNDFLIWAHKTISSQCIQERDREVMRYLGRYIREKYNISL